MSDSSTTTILLCGVGGQGTILAADLLAHAAIESGFDVKQSEIHGMAQRGGSVTSVVRFGGKVASMTTSEKSADIVISFERIEALRACSMLAEDGIMIVNDLTYIPTDIAVSKVSELGKYDERLEKINPVFVPANRYAEQAGSSKAVNVVLLGAASLYLPFEEQVWETVISQRVPSKFIDVNIEAFRLGRSINK